MNPQPNLRPSAFGFWRWIHTRGTKGVEIIRMYPKGTIGPTARLIRCRRARAWPLPKRLSRRSMEDGRWQINALMQPSLVGAG